MKVSKDKDWKQKRQFYPNLNVQPHTFTPRILQHAVKLFFCEDDGFQEQKF